LVAASRVRRWFARLLLATVAALLPLGAMEGMLRLMYPGSVDALNNASFTRVSMRPGQTTELIPGAVNPHFMGAGVRVNALGFRGAELDAPKPEGRFRLLAVGDSVTFGFGVPTLKGFVSLRTHGVKAGGARTGASATTGAPAPASPTTATSSGVTAAPSTPTR
jgi:hypothetical protein